MAWGGMPEHMIEKELARGVLKPVHVEGIEPRLSQLYLVRRTDKPIGLVADAIWQALQHANKKDHSHNESP
jgi:DNA-binding transcriptional LysR family regulator